MMTTLKTITLFLFIALFSFSGCKKDDEKQAPVINLKLGNTYTQDSAIIAVGGKLIFGIQARGTSENITNLTIKKVLEDGTVVTVMDTGVYSKFIDLDKVFYQNVEEKAVWTFSVMDRNRMSAQISMVVFKDPNSAFGGIYYYPSIKLGYQNNTKFGHFLDPATGVVYSADSATTYQDKIEILCYYIVSNNLPSPVLSSPGEMDNAGTEVQVFYPYIPNWTTRKYTKWDISVDNTPIAATEFDAVQNDSLLIVAYHDVWGKKKFRWATTGKIIPFITSAGKKGLIKVINADYAEDGTMEIALKIQQ